MLSNNDILKKIRVALSLRTEEVIQILSLVDFHITKGALGDLYRHEDHPNYQEAGDQILRRFLDGLVLYKRGQQDSKAGETVIDLRNQPAKPNLPKPAIAAKKPSTTGKLTYKPKPQGANPSQSAAGQFKSNYKKPK